jgi:sugar/nucleoside kinase (ribokinase family)
LLITDHEEALRLSGTNSVEEALSFFLDQGVGAAVVTNGARDISIAIASSRFTPLGYRTLPVCTAIVEELSAHPERKGDTTGAGDNFAGGVILSIASQLEAGHSCVDLVEAVAWGAVCGGAACFQMGGVYRERVPGEKRKFLELYLSDYKNKLKENKNVYHH